MIWNLDEYILFHKCNHSQLAKKSFDSVLSDTGTNREQ